MRKKNIIIQIKTNKMRKTLLENTNESHAICMAHIKKKDRGIKKTEIIQKWYMANKPKSNKRNMTNNQRK